MSQAPPPEGSARQHARDHAVAANFRLVVAVARTFQGRGLELAELVREGDAGLLEAVDRFDWRQDVAFSTYAAWWIRRSIQSAVQAAQGRESSELDDLSTVLDERERQILGLRRGVDGNPSASFAEIGAVVRLSRQRVRQIDARARSKLQHPSRGRHGHGLLAG
jgi:RNA polymerase primary sigma factor